jgi:hypothetical protein
MAGVAIVDPGPSYEAVLGGEALFSGPHERIK